MADKITFSDLFDLSNSSDLKKAIKLISDMDKVYEKLADGIKKESNAIEKALKENAKAAKELQTSYTSLSKGAGKTKEATKEYVTQSEKLYNQQQELSKQQKVAIKNLDKLKKEQDKVNAAAKETEKINKQRLSLSQKLAQAESKEAKEVAELRVRLQEKNKQVKEAARESLGLISVYQKESKRLNDMRKKYKDLALTVGENAKESRELASEIQTLDKKLKDVDASVGQFQRNVGDYKNQMSEAIEETSLFGVSIGGIKNGLKSLLNPVTAIVAGITALGTAYASTTRGTRDLQRASDRLDTSFTLLGNSIADLVGATEDEGIFDKFVDTALTNLLDRLLPGLGTASQAIADRVNEIRENLREIDLRETRSQTRLKALLDEAEALRQVRDEERNSIQTRLDANFKLTQVLKTRQEERLSFIKDEKAEVEELIATLGEEPELLQRLAELNFELADIREETRGFESEALANDLALFKELKAEQLRAETARINEQILLVEEGSRKELELRLKLVDITENLLLESAGEFEERRTAIMQEATNERLSLYKDYKNSINKLDRIGLTIFDKTEKKKTDTFIANIEAQMDAFSRKYTKEREEAERTARLVSEYEERKKQNYIDTAYAGVDAINSLFARRQQAVEEELNLLQQETDRKLELAAENEEGQEIIRQRAAERERELQRQLAEERRKQAIFNKSVAIAEIAINTALGITKSIAQLGLPAAIPFVISAGILGAAQAAAVIAEPIPAFAKGTDNSPEGLAWVGEEGREIVVRPSGEAYVTPDKPTLVDLEGGSQVLTNAISENILKGNDPVQANSQSNNTLRDVIGTRITAENQARNMATLVAKENDILMKQLKKMTFNQPVNQFYFEDGDLKTAIKKGNTTIKNAKAKYTFKG